MNFEYLDKIIERIIVPKYPWIDWFTWFVLTVEGDNYYSLTFYAKKNQYPENYRQLERELKSEVQSLFSMMGPERYEYFRTVTIL